MEPSNQVQENKQEKQEITLATDQQNQPEDLQSKKQSSLKKSVGTHSRGKEVKFQIPEKQVKQQEKQDKTSEDSSEESSDSPSSSNEDERQGKNPENPDGANNTLIKSEQQTGKTSEKPSPVSTRKGRPLSEKAIKNARRSKKKQAKERKAIVDHYNK